nr:T9SS type A sorting domain-containing protein [Saprospiraceae bacterium]
PYMIKGRTFPIVPNDLDIRDEVGAWQVDKYAAVSFVESSFNETTGELEFKAAEFDPKCGISVHVDAWKLDGGQCAQQYKVNVEIKQSCYGTPGLYTRGAIGDIEDFEGTFHPKFWEYSRSDSDFNIVWNNDEGAPRRRVWAADGRLFQGLKDINEAESVRLQPGTQMCATIPQTGIIVLDVMQPTAGQGGYTINGGSKIEFTNGENTIEVEACDEICILCRGTDENGITIRDFVYSEADVTDGPLEALDADGYWKCEFWVVDLDTLPPTVECKLDYANEDFVDEENSLVYVPTSSHDCAAHTYIPPVKVVDDWSGVKIVKAIIPGINTIVMERGDEPNCWVSHKQIKIPHGDIETPIYYEAFDSCHRIGRDTCYMKVKDLTRPVPVCDKGVIVGLSGKKVWVDAETFDEGSWDNCGIALKLARRTDWYEHCIDLCDDVTATCWNEHYDTIYCANLEEDKHIDPVEAHYYKTMKWLKEDGRPCTDLIWNAWKYDLCKYATLHCVDHKYDVDEHYFRKLAKEVTCPDPVFENELGTGNGGRFGADDEDAAFDLFGDIGGGWSDAVPFDCEDACKNVTVELLVVDYWCNWAKCWENVWVEDKTPVTVKHDVEDLEITCGAYKEKKYDFPHSDHPVSIQHIVDLAKDGDQYALSHLDSLFGGYEKVWVDEYGNTPARKKGLYWDQECECDEFTEKKKVYDEHLGYVWETVAYDSCWVEHDSITPYWGQVVVNCAAYCDQEVWCDFDHCGQGYIFRKWKFVPGCTYDDKQSHPLDTITRKQVIWVGNNCELDKGMFYKPDDTMVVACGIEYDDAGNATGALDPEVLGAPEYMFDDDCRIVGITHSDKVFKIVGGDEACYKIVRSWHFMDWCYLGGKPENDQFWWLNPEYEGRKLHWEQKIIVRDTTPPVCTFAEELDVVDAPGCYYTLDQDVMVSDACGVLNYYWELHSIKGSEKTLIEDGEGEFEEGDTSMFNITVADLGTGDYKLKVRVRDECQNEHYCEDDFEVIAGKKPAAICITSLTAELTPWDIDQDGTIDSAKATIWAAEFNSSSEPACGSTGSLEYRIEIIDGVDDDTFEEDSTSLSVSCEHVGNLMIRLWVIDPSGSFDFCDVILVVQNNMGGCGDNSRANNTIVGSIANELNESVEQVEVRAELENGQVLNYLTTASGAYAFAAALGLDVKVTPVKDVADLNGITTLDLVKIQKHILAKEELTSMYRKVAADANADGKINTVDLIQLRKLILGKEDKLPENTSWRFFDAEESKEQYSINAIDGLMQLNWVGVKIGDVNLDSDPSRSAGRSSNNMVMSLEDEIMTAGNQYKVAFRAGAFNDISGFQYTLRFDEKAVNVADISMGNAIALSEENFNLDQVAEGIITSSWNSFEGVTMPENEVLFTLTLEAKQGAQLSDVLAVNSSKTAAEAYNSLDQVASVALSFDNAKLISNEFALFQNNPNPFMESTVIGFNLPSESAVTLTIFDITGKAVYTTEGDFAKGYNQFSVQAKDLGAQGVVYYQIDTEDFTATKKMIVVE